MEIITYRKTLDVQKSGVQFMLQGFETADKMSRRIIISLMASGDTIDLPLEQLEAVMYVSTPGIEGQSVNKCSINGNNIIYDVLPITGEGVTTMQLKLIETTSEGPRRVLGAPKFAVEVSKSEADDESIEETAAFTALEEATAKAKAVYDERVVKIEITDDCIFVVHYADGTTYETDAIRKMLLKESTNLNLEKLVKNGLTSFTAEEVSDAVLEILNVQFGEKIEKNTSAIEALEETDKEIKQSIETIEDNTYKKTDILTYDTRTLLNLDEGSVPDLAFNSLYSMLSIIPGFLTFIIANDGNVGGETLLDAAFGKNNEDLMRGVGRQIATYAWFKGLDKTKYPLTNLSKMQTLNNMNLMVYNEIIEMFANDEKTLYNLIKSSAYAKNKVFDTFSDYQTLTNSSSGTGDGSLESTTQITITEAHLSSSFILNWSYYNSNKAAYGSALYINDIKVTNSTTSGGERGGISGIKNWSDYNISSPGTYTVRMLLEANVAPSTTTGSYSFTCAKDY